MGARPLSNDQVEEIRTWIANGASWPAGFELGRAKDDWWSLRPLSRPDPPKTDSPWVRTPIDRFILAKLAEKRLTPSAEADRATLIRRLTYGLHGLPPAWDEIQAFL